MKAPTSLLHSTTKTQAQERAVAPVPESRRKFLSLPKTNSAKIRIMSRFAAILLMLSGCTAKPDWVSSDGAHWRIVQTCVASHEEFRYGWHYGWNPFNPGHYEWHACWHPVEICDSTRSDTLRIRRPDGGPSTSEKNDKPGPRATCSAWAWRSPTTTPPAPGTPRPKGGWRGGGSPSRRGAVAAPGPQTPEKDNTAYYILAIVSIGLGFILLQILNSI